MMSTMARKSQHRSPRPEDTGNPTSSGERLQKALAAAGIGSRRDCEELILEGRVEIDRQVVTKLGVRVDPLRQDIRVDGVALTRPKRHYYAVNKPPGVVCTNEDPAGRMRVVDLVQTDVRLFTVGRLDRTSEGLIIVTNDGHLAHRLTHPRFGVEKTYAVRVVGHPTAEQLRQLRQGVHLAEALARVVSLRVRRRHKQHTDLEIVLNEGRNREIRRILARIGHKVVHLRRTAVGGLHLGDLPVGAHRRLTRDEVRSLEQCIEKPRKGAAGKQESRKSDSAGRKSAAKTSAPASRGVRSGAKGKSKSRRDVAAARSSTKRTADRNRGRAKRSRRK
jgi:23S rRNA pseudouridine2605 synthase